MRFREFIWAGFGILWTIGFGGPLPAQVVATFNLRNERLGNRWANGAFRFDYPKPEEEQRANDALIARLSPDLLFVQEVGNAQHLEDVRQRLLRRGCEYPESHFSGGEGQWIGLGILSRYPLKEVIHFSFEPGTGPDSGRGIQAVRWESSHGPEWWLHVHLKSRWSEDPHDPQSAKIRAAEAGQLCRLANRLREVYDSSPILVGDFNAPFEDPSLAHLVRDGWIPVAVEDIRGESTTYEWDKGEGPERLDGFWEIGEMDRMLEGVGIFPSSGSDHRLVMVRIGKVNSGGQPPASSQSPRP